MVPAIAAIENFPAAVCVADGALPEPLGAVLPVEEDVLVGVAVDEGDCALRHDASVLACTGSRSVAPP